MRSWLDNRASGVLLGLNHYASALSSTVSDTKPVPVKNYKIMELINWVNSLAKNTIVIQGEDSNVSAQLLRQLKLVRQHFLPLQQFDGCTILRGTLGSVNPEEYLDDSSYCIMWKKKEPKQVFVARVSVVHDMKFDPLPWSILLFWAEGSRSRPDVATPTADETMPQAPTGAPAAVDDDSAMDQQMFPAQPPPAQSDDLDQQFPPSQRGWDVGHIDLKTAFLQGESYDELRDVVCQLPTEAGLPWYMAARLKKPAYGMNDAPRRWWNIIDGSLRKYGMVQTRADRCCYVLYSDRANTKSRVSDSKIVDQDKNDRVVDMAMIDKAIDLLIDPIASSPSRGREVLGVVNLHVDDLFFTGADDFERLVLKLLRKDFQVGSEDKNDVVFTGQRVLRRETSLEVDQQLAIEELEEIQFGKSLADNVVCTSDLHTRYRSVLGSINWLQSRTQYQAAYRFSRCAAASAGPTIGDVRALNKLVRSIKNEPAKLIFHKLKNPCRLIGIPDASYRNNADKSSQRGQCIFLSEERKVKEFPESSLGIPRSRKEKGEVPRLRDEAVGVARGSLVDFESHKINRTTLSTTVAELYSFMKAYGTCLFLKGLWCDISGEAVPIHMRTDANNLVTTASTTHLPEQRETIHMIQMLRKESNSGNIDDLSHVRTEHCLADALTKNSAKPDALLKAVETGNLPGIDTHPPFMELLKHKAYLTNFLTRELCDARRTVEFMGCYVRDWVLSCYSFSR